MHVFGDEGTPQPFSLWQLTQAWTCPRKPMLAEWTSSILSLPLTCQKDVASCLLQLLDRIDETLT